MNEIPEGFIAHDGGPCPVDYDVAITPYYRGPVDHTLGVRRSFGPAIKFAWQHDGQDDDIIAYAVQPEGE